MECALAGGRTAGKGGIGDGDRPARPTNAVVLSDGDPAACDPENEERRDPGLVDDAGGSMGCGVDGIDADAEGVIGVARWRGMGCGGSVNSEAEVIADPASDTFDPLRARFGRDPDGNDGVREWRISIRVARETGWTSGIPLLKPNVLTWTDLSISFGPARPQKV